MTDRPRFSGTVAAVMSVPALVVRTGRRYLDLRNPRTDTAGQPVQPWFRAHPGVAVAVISVSALTVFALQLLDKQSADAVALLYSLPIALAAVTFGVAGGVGAAAASYLAFGLFAAFSNDDHVGLDGWLSRAAAMFLLGWLVGRAYDQTARAGLVALAHQHRRLVVEEQNRRYSEGIELSDSILQHVAAAKWALEQGDHEKAAGLLSRALSSGQEMVAELLPSATAAPAPPPTETASRTGGREVL